MEIRNRYNDVIYSGDFATIKECVEYAVRNGVDLSFAYLSFANLLGVNLSFANLLGANLLGANLLGANLSHSNLECSILSGSNLMDTIGNGKEIITVQTPIWVTNYTSEIMQIGCENHRIDEWWGFSDERICRMDSNALQWWKVWKPLLQQIIKANPAKPTK